MTHLSSSAEFYSHLRNFKSPKSSSSTVAALFYADWVEGSDQLIETVTALQEEYEETVIFLIIKADKLTDLSQTFNVAKLPSVLFFNNESSSSDLKAGKKIESPTSEQLITTVEQIVEDGYLNLDNIQGESIPSNIDEILQAQANKQSNNAFTSQSLNSTATSETSLNSKLKSIINKSKFMIFIKGTPEAAKCGFSRTCLEIMKEQDIDFGYFDILSDEEVRQGLKKYSDWPTYPQMYFNGELLGGLDIFKEMVASGELAKMDIPKKSSASAVAAAVASMTAPAANPETLSPEMSARLKSIITSNKIMVFMKGEQTAPRCKFSKMFVALMTEEGFPPGSYGSFDILSDEEVRQKIKIYSNWPTFPQLYVNEELIGGIDIIKELIETGEFQEVLSEAV